MKKTLLTILSVTLLMAFAASALTVSAASAVTQYGEAKTLASTLPVIDGKIDDIYEEANTYYLEILKVGYDTEVKGYFKILWTPATLYVLVVAPDPTPNWEATDDYKKDTLEIALDLSNARTNSYINDDQMNLRFYRSGDDMLVARDGNGTVTSDEVSYAYTDDGSCYIYEFALQCDKLGITLKADQVIGFDAQINDNEEGLGERAACYAWNDDGDAVYNDPTYMGEIKFVSTAVGPAPVEEETTAVVETAPAAVQIEPVAAPVSAPETSDVSIFAVISAVLAISVFITVKKARAAK